MTGQVVWVVDGDTIPVRIGARLFLRLEREARAAGRGLWGHA